MFILIITLFTFIMFLIAFNKNNTNDMIFFGFLTVFNLIGFFNK